ncbi:glycosyltransferase family 39 protein [Sphingomonas sp. GB1N7]|uniref:glycosyltransferase family 39 protein n=1 Tax=Parasphingomonas caseinilytica TaxID=3096158 RepID=UPI002FC78513
MTGQSQNPWPARAALTAATLAFAWGLARLAAHAAFAFGYPYDLDYGEGVVWQQMRYILAGHGYAPLQAFPAFVFEYPPVYPLVTAGTARVFGLDELYAGRLVSFVATAICALLIALLTARAIPPDQPRRIRRAAAAFAALAFVTLPVVLTWALLMRIDMLACAITLAGMALAAASIRRPKLAIAAGIAFAAALYTRQTNLPAPAAAFLVLVFANRRAAWTMLAAAIVSGGIALAILEAMSGGYFLVNILFYNINRIVWAHATMLGAVLLASIVTLALGTIGLVAASKSLGWRTLRERLPTDPNLVTLALVVLTLALKTLMLPAILKSGASDNYLIDWFSGIAVLIGIAVVPLLRAATRLPARPSLLLLALVGLGIAVQMSDPPLTPDTAKAACDRPALDAIVARIRASPKPVITDDMVLLLRAGQPILWEPAIVAELGGAGVYDERALAARVRRGDFGFFVTRGDRGRTLYDQRFNPVVADAIDAAYPRREQAGDLTLHLPR